MSCIRLRVFWPVLSPCQQQSSRPSGTSPGRHRRTCRSDNCCNLVNIQSMCCKQKNAVSLLYMQLGVCQFTPVHIQVSTNSLHHYSITGSNMVAFERVDSPVDFPHLCLTQLIIPCSCKNAIITTMLVRRYVRLLHDIEKTFLGL